MEEANQDPEPILRGDLTLLSSPNPPLVDMIEDDFDNVALDMQQVLEFPLYPVLWDE